MARAELFRSRRYLFALVQGLGETDLEWLAPRRDATRAKWHLGRIALAERQRLAALIEGLDVAESAPFGRHLAHDRHAELPTWPEIRRTLVSVRRLTTELLAHVDGERAEAVFLDIVNLELAEARFVRRVRLELGRPDVPDPHGRLLHVDTDADVPPRFHVPTFRPQAPETRRPGQVVSLDERRGQRADAALSRGHRLVGAGDLRAALRAFEEAGGLVPSADALTYQAWMHALLGNLETAEDLCLHAIRMDPEFGNPYNDMGTIKVQRRDVTSAIQWFEKAKRARRYEPRHFPFMNLGRLYLSLGMPEKALREFEGALTHAPGNQEVRTAVDHLRRQLEEREA